MYYVDRRQIDARLEFIPFIVEAMRQLQENGQPQSPLDQLAQERALQLAIEAVTDVGSLMIDGFLMREASSYEDIVEILHGENVLDTSIVSPLIELVRLRKPLMQEYMTFKRDGFHPLLPQLPDVLERFSVCVREYIQKELG